ncbi:MAG: hypothetical protein JW822_07765 [Spirochaetales bacterium]|nr:hypothetical protein [Spirochaetales bacterium]
MDDTNLYYFGARYYDPAMGIFISADPAMDGLNWYTYCANNPMNYVDPWGLMHVDNYGADGGGSIGDNSNNSGGTPGGNEGTTDNGNNTDGGPGPAEGLTQGLVGAVQAALSMVAPGLAALGGGNDDSGGGPPPGTPITGPGADASRDQLNRMGLFNENNNNQNDNMNSDNGLPFAPKDLNDDMISGIFNQNYTHTESTFTYHEGVDLGIEKGTPLISEVDADMVFVKNPSDNNGKGYGKFFIAQVQNPLQNCHPFRK